MWAMLSLLLGAWPTAMRGLARAATAPHQEKKHPNRVLVLWAMLSLLLGTWPSAMRGLARAATATHQEKKTLITDMCGAGDVHQTHKQTGKLFHDLFIRWPALL